MVYLRKKKKTCNLSAMYKFFGSAAHDVELRVPLDGAGQ